MKLAPVTSISTQPSPLCVATLIANLPDYVNVELESIPDYNGEGKIEKKQFDVDMAKRYENGNGTFICFAFIRLTDVAHNQNFGFRSDGIDPIVVDEIIDDMKVNGWQDDVKGAPPPIWNCVSESLVDGHHRYKVAEWFTLHGINPPEYMPVAVFHFQDSSFYKISEFAQGIHIQRKARNDYKTDDTIDLLVNQFHKIAEEECKRVQDYTKDDIYKFFESGSLFKQLKQQTRTKIINRTYEILSLGGERDVWKQEGEQWESWSPDAVDRRKSSSKPTHFRALLNLDLGHIEGTFWSRYICETTRTRVMRIGFHSGKVDPKKIAKAIFSSLSKLEIMNEYLARAWEDRGEISFGKGNIVINTKQNKIDRVKPDQIEIIGIVPLLHEKTKKERVSKQYVGIRKFCKLVGYELSREEKRLLKLFDIKD